MNFDPYLSLPVLPSSFFLSQKLYRAQIIGHCLVLFVCSSSLFVRTVFVEPFSSCFTGWFEAHFLDSPVLIVVVDEGGDLVRPVTAFIIE
jgi:hypothetical protein